MLPNPEIDKLIQIAEDTALLYMQKDSLSVDEEVQLLASAYAILFLKAVDHSSTIDLSKAHGFLNQCFQKVGDTQFSRKHRVMEEAYRKI
ncbi:MAG: hypothetical protein ACAH59_02860 [Pseudobdellovibrionaceae bacterium]